MPMKILWGITGSGDFIRATISMMKDVNSRAGVEVKVVVSKSARTVLGMYGVWDEVETGFEQVGVERDPNNPFVVGAMQTGKFDLFLICPATANTTAKLALGIADTMISNAAAMAMKSNIPVYVFPVDQLQGELATDAPGGEKLTISIRGVDIENVERLRGMEGVTVLTRPEEFLDIIGGAF